MTRLLCNHLANETPDYTAQETSCQGDNCQLFCFLALNCIDSDETNRQQTTPNVTNGFLKSELCRIVGIYANRSNVT